MSNQVGIYPTRFVTIDLDGNEQESSIGLRVADDFDSTYCNTYRNEDIIGRSPSEIVALARCIDERAGAMIEFAEENLDGVYIGDDFHPWPELKPRPVTGSAAT